MAVYDERDDTPAHSEQAARDGAWNGPVVIGALTTLVALAAFAVGLARDPISVRNDTLRPTPAFPQAAPVAPAGSPRF